MTEERVDRPAVRAALPGDIPAMRKLLMDQFCLESDLSTDRKKQEKDLRLLLEQSSGSSAVFVAVQQGQVAGLCSVRTVVSGEGAPAGIVENLVVRRGCQKQGIGGSLLGSAMIWCTKQGITRMQVVSDRADVPAIQFCFSRGWTDTGSIRLNNGL